MRVTNQDIDALIEATSFLAILAKKEPNDVICGKMRNIASHVRKVYILLLKSAGREVIDLKQLVFDGIFDDPELTKAITALCPHTQIDPNKE